MMNAQTDRAISTGLAWLAKSQNPDGSFGNGTYRGNIAVTSLAGLAFMAAGSSPGRGPFGTHVDKALNYVMENTAPSGFIAVSSAATHGPMYSHGFGALFLAEAYGMTHRPEIREKLQKAIRPHHRHAEQGRRLALPAGPPRRRPLGDDLPDQRPPRREECRPVRPQGDGRRLHPLCQALAEPRRRLRYMLQGGASAFPRSAAGPGALYKRGVYDSKEIDSGIAYLKQYMPEIKLGNRYSHYFYGHTTRRRRCGIGGASD
jgi:hypothetical protein